MDFAFFYEITSTCSCNSVFEIFVINIFCAVHVDMQTLCRWIGLCTCILLFFFFRAGEARAKGPETSLIDLVNSQLEVPAWGYPLYVTFVLLILSFTCSRTFF